MRKLLNVIPVFALCLTFPCNSLADKDRPSFFTEVPKGRTIAHYYGALRMAFPTIETLDPTKRPAKPKPFDQKPVPLQTHRVISNSEDPERILLGSDDKATTTFWMRLYEAEGDLPERLASCVGMPEAEWILERDTYLTLRDVKVRGFTVRVTLKDYHHRDPITGIQSVITNVIHVLAENLDVQKPGELVFSLPTGKQRVFVLSEKQGLFVFSDISLEGSSVVQMKGWREKRNNLPNKPDSGDGK